MLQTLISINYVLIGQPKTNNSNLMDDNK